MCSMWPQIGRWKSDGMRFNRLPQVVGSPSLNLASTRWRGHDNGYGMGDTYNSSSSGGQRRWAPSAAVNMMYAENKLNQTFTYIIQYPNIYHSFTLTLFFDTSSPENTSKRSIRSHRWRTDAVERGEMVNLLWLWRMLQAYIVCGCVFLRMPRTDADLWIEFTGLLGSSHRIVFFFLLDQSMLWFRDDFKISSSAFVHV